MCLPAGWGECCYSPAGAVLHTLQQPLGGLHVDCLLHIGLVDVGTGCLESIRLGFVGMIRGESRPESFLKAPRLPWA